MGLSTDKEMGDDSVMECVKEGDEIKVYSSWTTVGANYASVREGIVSYDSKKFIQNYFLLLLLPNPATRHCQTR